MKLSHLTSLKGEIARRPYLLWGLLLVAVKYNLDRLLALSFDRQWFLTDYFAHADQLGIEELSKDDRLFYLCMLLASIPFIWFGTILTLKRLRDAELSPYWVLVFFLPFINLLMFGILALIPGKEESKKSLPESRLEKFIPRTKLGSALVSIGVVAVFSLILTGIFLNYLEEYGWSLFVGIPFFLGFASVKIHSYNRVISYREALGVAFLTLAICCVSIIILAFEGIICLGMAAPIFGVVTWVGGSIAYNLSKKPSQAGTVSMVVAPASIILFLGFIESFSPTQVPLISVETSVVIKADKQAIWDQLVAFTEIDEPTEWMFQTGIAYPTHAEIRGKGVGAVRECHFTTGAFIEPITTWDEPNMLAFSVEKQPPPMIEWSIYDKIDVAHVDGYFLSEKGQFKLEAIDSLQVKLTGTTWYKHKIWPNRYWQLWSDAILHKIHYRVLDHIKAEAEKVAS